MAMDNPPPPGEFIIQVYREPNNLSGRELAGKLGVAERFKGSDSVSFQQKVWGDLRGHSGFLAALTDSPSAEIQNVAISYPQWRVIYRVVIEKLTFQVASITAHDYRRP